MELEVFNAQGQTTGQTVELPERVFGGPVNEHAVYLAVKAQLANRRQGTHSTKTRSMVRGGGKKPWKQKGRGVARAGTNRSPIWVGGGRIFGPHPHPYGEKVNKKVKKLARRSVLASRLSEERLFVVDDFNIESGKTRELIDFLDGFETNGEKSLLLLADSDSAIVRAGKNIPNFQAYRADLASTYDMIQSRRIFVQKGALAVLEEVLS